MEDEYDRSGPRFARSPFAPVIGKCTACIKVYVPEDVLLEVELESQRLGGTPSEIGRDLFFKWLNGVTYTKHVANIRESALQGKGLEKDQLALRVIGEVGANDRKLGAA
jgi:hypothetical protein